MGVLIGVKVRFVRINREIVFMGKWKLLVVPLKCSQSSASIWASLIQNRFAPWKLLPLPRYSVSLLSTWPDLLSLTYPALSLWHLHQCPTLPPALPPVLAFATLPEKLTTPRRSTSFLSSFAFLWSHITTKTFLQVFQSTLSPLIQTLCDCGLIGWMGRMAYIADRKSSSCLPLRSR